MRRVILAIVSTVAGLVLLLSFKTHSTLGRGDAPSGSRAATGSSGSTAAVGSGSTPARSRPSRRRRRPSSRHRRRRRRHAVVRPARPCTGDAVDTRYGPVQVQITVTNGTVTAVQRVDYPQQRPAGPADQLLRDPDAEPGGASPPAARRSTRSPARRTPATATSRRCRARSTRPGCDERPLDATAAPRTVHVEHCMGTVFTHRHPRRRRLGRRDRRRSSRWLHHVDAVFSTYRDDSDISRIRRGELRSPTPTRRGRRRARPLRASCRRETDGYFSALVATAGSTRPGWSRAGRSSGPAGCCASTAAATTPSTAAATSSSPARPRPASPGAIGISDPLDRTRILTVVDRPRLRRRHAPAPPNAARTSSTRSPACRPTDWPASPSSARR